MQSTTIIRDNSATSDAINSALRGDRLTTAEAAKYLGVSDGTLNTWRSTGRFVIPFLKVGGKVFYRKGDLDKFLDGCLQANGTTA